MTAPAAPLEKAVEEAREILSGAHSNCAPCLATGLHTLLAALDADKRLERAEEALMHIKQGDLCVDGLRPGLYGHGMEFARRYFAERGER